MADPLSKYKTPERLTLYSISNPRDRNSQGKEGQNKNMFGAYLVRGQADIANPQTRDRIFSALKQSISQSNESAMAKCFNPHHGIRAIHQGKTVDYTICFECSRVEVNDGKSVVELPISSGSEQGFNEFLKAANIPLK